MVIVNPEILVWARETAGLSVADAARKLGLSDSKRASSIDKLVALESGVKEPTRVQVVKMAEKYRRPLLTFYLSKPPVKGDRGVDFRTLPADGSSDSDAVLDALIRDVRARQSMVRAVLEDEDEAGYLPFVGALSISDGTAGVVDYLCNLLGASILSEYRALTGADASFRFLRSRVEDVGVFVLLKGDLGSHHTELDVDETFRGFSIADEVAPFVVINHNDSKAAWSFTLLHEMTHLLLGHTGVSAGQSGNDIERFCDDVASQFLLPSDDLKKIAIGKGMSTDLTSQKIGDFAREANVSRAMVAYRAYRVGKIESSTYRSLVMKFRQEWRDQRVRVRESASEKDGGPSYYVIRRHRVGGALMGLVSRMMAADALSTSKAAKVLGVKPRQVQPLLESGVRG